MVEPDAADAALEEHMRPHDLLMHPLKEPCVPVCRPVSMSGRSVWKCWGYNRPCRCFQDAVNAKLAKLSAPTKT